MADNSTQGGTDTIRDKDRAGVKTQIFGLDLNPNGASEVLQAAAALADATANPTVPAWAAMGMLFNGTTWDRIRGDTTNGVDVDVTRLPGSPAQEHTTAASPGSARLSDGAAFYNTNTGGQLPAALVSGRLDVNIGASPVTLPVSLAAVPTVTEKQDQTANVATTWTSATGLNTTTATYAATGYGTANVAIRVPTTTTAGAVTIEVSQDGTDWVPAGAVRQDNSAPENPVPLAYFPGVNGTRIYALSIDAFTLVRVKLTTVIVGAGNVVVTISAVAGGIEPVVAQRSRKVATYRAVVRTAARPYVLSAVNGAAGRKQVATIHHAAAATKTVRLRRVRFAVSGFSAASFVVFDLVRVTTAPATGNPAVTAGPTDTADAAFEATVLALPTTAGTEGTVISSLTFRAGVLGAASTASPPPPNTDYDLLGPGTYDDEAKAPVIRAGVLEGWAVTFDSDAANTATLPYVIFEFTEEAP